jgi:uncharacterized protein YxeA
MKKQILMTALALFICAAITAQTTQQIRTQTQTGKQSRVQTQEQPGTRTRTQTGRQEAMQYGYKNNGQMTKAQKHARNEERKALKEQQKEMKRKKAGLNNHKYSGKENIANQNKSMRPPVRQNDAAKVAKSPRQTGKK